MSWWGFHRGSEKSWGGVSNSSNFENHLIIDNQGMKAGAPQTGKQGMYRSRGNQHNWKFVESTVNPKVMFFSRQVVTCTVNNKQWYRFGGPHLTCKFRATLHVSEWNRSNFLPLPRGKNHCLAGNNYNYVFGILLRPKAPFQIKRSCMAQARECTLKWLHHHHQSCRDKLSKQDPGLGTP